MCCLSFFINKKMLGKKLCVGMCLKCLMVATPLPNVEYASSAWDPYQEKIKLKRLKWCKEDQPVSLSTSTDIEIHMSHLTLFSPFIWCSHNGWSPSFLESGSAF